MEIALGSQQKSEITWRSLVMHSLDLAASDPSNMLSIICHLYDEMEHLVCETANFDESDSESVVSDETEDEDNVKDMSFDEL